MNSKSIHEIYSELQRQHFRFRNVDTLQDWILTGKFDWKWDGDKLIEISAVKLSSDFTGIITSKLDATIPIYALLSTKEELSKIENFAPHAVYQYYQKSYLLLKDESIPKKQCGKVGRPFGFGMH